MTPPHEAAETLRERKGTVQNVLITGVGTMLGNPLAKLLASSGHRVEAIYRSRNPWVDNLASHPEIELVRADLRDPRSLRSCHLDCYDTVIHLAATSPQQSVNVRDMVNDNVVATSHLVDFAIERRASRFLFMSSMSVYGEVTSSVVSAATAIVNPSPYGTSKRLSEQLLEDVADRLPAVSLRIPALLGPGAHRHWLAALVERARSGAEVTIFNPTAMFNNAVHVDELGPFIASLATAELAGFAAIPIGARGHTTIQNVARQIIDGMGAGSPLIVRESSAISFTIDYTLAAELFGYAPSHITSVLSRYLSDCQSRGDDAFS